jgi:ribosomal protein S14
MSSLGKYIANQERKKIIDKEKPALNKLKRARNKIAKTHDRNIAISNIEAKLQNPNQLTAVAKKRLEIELAKYKAQNAETPEVSMGEKWKMQLEINKLGHKVGVVKYRNRCSLRHCARPNGFVGHTGLCRIHTMEQMRYAQVPGMPKKDSR